MSSCHLRRVPYLPAGLRVLALENNELGEDLDWEALLRHPPSNVLCLWRNDLQSLPSGPHWAAKFRHTKFHLYTSLDLRENPRLKELPLAVWQTFFRELREEYPDGALIGVGAREYVTVVQLTKDQIPEYFFQEPGRVPTCVAVEKAVGKLLLNQVLSGWRLVSAMRCLLIHSNLILTLTRSQL